MSTENKLKKHCERAFFVFIYYIKKHQNSVMWSQRLLVCCACTRVFYIYLIRHCILEWGSPTRLLPMINE
jgi:hypothetical protein